MAELLVNVPQSQQLKVLIYECTVVYPKGMKKFHNTLKPRYNKHLFSKILDIVNKTQLPSWDFIEIVCLDIVNDSI